jgi:hypothetical protein
MGKSISLHIVGQIDFAPYLIRHQAYHSSHDLELVATPPASEWALFIVYRGIMSSRRASSCVLIRHVRTLLKGGQFHVSVPR